MTKEELNLKINRDTYHQDRKKLSPADLRVFFERGRISLPFVRERITIKKAKETRSTEIVYSDRLEHTARRFSA